MCLLLQIFYLYLLSSVQYTAASNSLASKLGNLISRITIKNTEGSFPLHEACQQSDLQQVQKLITIGADINLPDNSGITPLMYASQGSLECVEALIKAGANIDQKDKRGHTALYQAAIHDQYAIGKHLIEHTAMVESQDHNGHTILHHACRKGAASIVQLLVDYKANVNHQSEYGETPFLALVNSKELPEVEETDGMNSKMERWYSCVKTLLKAGLDFDLVSNHETTPLIAAVKRNRLDLVMLLVANGAHVDRKAIHGFTPLNWAVWHGQNSIAKYLLHKKASVNAVEDDRQSTPLHYACIRGNNDDMAMLLLSYGANPNLLDDDQETPLGQCKFPKADPFQIQTYRYCLQPNIFSRLTPINQKIVREDIFRLPNTFTGKADFIVFSMLGSMNWLKEKVDNKELQLYSEFAQKLYRFFVLFDPVLAILQKSAAMSNFEFIARLFEDVEQYLDSKCRETIPKFHFNPKQVIPIFDILFLDGDYKKLLFLSKGVARFFKTRIDSKRRIPFFNHLITWYSFATEAYLQVPIHMVELLCYRDYYQSPHA